MRRTDRRPAGVWIRDAWLNDEALQLTANLHERLTGQQHPMVAALASGKQVTAHMWELPDVVADRLRSDGCLPHQRFRLTTDDELEPS
ncbi:hypothetical protein [Gordonia sp. CPCC 205333]|uniref:hypothetical protein n=1 Tax=Gordonia sp. CPCC 205333 TaxID=3140790 RepID=UPI003AF33771